MPKGSNKSFKLKGISITAEKGIDRKAVSSSQLFTDWLEGVDRDRFTIKSIHFQSVDIWRKRVGFIKFKCDVVDQNGNRINGIVFSRGGSVAIIVMVQCEDERYAVVTVQPRLATGCFEFAEICAGMLDGSGNFAGVAAKELEEELGITINTEDLTDLTELAGYSEGLYLSPGGSDEFMRFFAYCTTMDRVELDDLNGRLTGALGENEHITVKLVKVEDLLTLPDAKTIVAYSLLTRFQDQIPGCKTQK